MKKPLVSMIAVIGPHGELGLKNRLLWHIPEDLARFKKLTLHHPVIMGKTTFQSIGKPLQERENFVVSRNKDLLIPGCRVCHSLEEALDEAGKIDRDEIFIIGGGQIYKEGIKYSDKLYLTLVEGEYKADTFFPDYSDFGKVILKEEKEDGKYTYIFLEIIRKNSGKNC